MLRVVPGHVYVPPLAHQVHVRHDATRGSCQQGVAAHERIAPIEELLVDILIVLGQKGIETLAGNLRVERRSGQRPTGSGPEVVPDIDEPPRQEGRRPPQGCGRRHRVDARVRCQVEPACPDLQRGPRRRGSRIRFVRCSSKGINLDRPRVATAEAGHFAPPMSRLYSALVIRPASRNCRSTRVGICRGTSSSRTGYPCHISPWSSE